MSHIRVSLVAECRPTGRAARPRRLGIWCGLAISVVVGYALCATNRMGLVWPYPMLLPQTVSLSGERYTQSGGCHPLAWWARVQHRKVESYITIGHLESAVYVGRPAAISADPPDRPYPVYLSFLVVRGSCYVFYGGDFGS